MYRYFDIDDLGQSQVMRSSELDDFESFSPEHNAYQTRWKELVASGMNKKAAKKQAQKELNYNPTAALLKKAGEFFGNKAEDPAVDAEAADDAPSPTPPPPPLQPSTAGVGGGLGGSITIAGIQVPMIALLGVAGVGAWYFMKKR